MKKAKIIVCVILLLCMSTLFVACEYGDPDKLGIANMNFGQRILIGLQVAFLGLAMVFLVLVLLILFINLLKVILNIDYKKLFSKKKKEAPVEVKETVVAENQDSSNQADEEVVAVIMASLMAYYQVEGEVEYKSELPFRVRSIKEIK